MLEKNNRIVTMTFTAMMTAVICVLSPFSVPIPFSPVPITLATLALYLAAYLLGSKQGTLSCLLYLLIGMTGLPVFSNFSGGIGKLAGPTGGYLLGYLPMVFVIGFFTEHFENRLLQAVGYILGTAILYLFGTVWFVLIGEGYSFAAAIGMCALPYLPGDIAKIIVTLLVAPTLKARINKATMT